MTGVEIIDFSLQVVYAQNTNWEQATKGDKHRKYNDGGDFFSLVMWDIRILLLNLANSHVPFPLILFL